MVLKGSISAKPGQFINIKLSEHYLRRPISISRIHTDSFEIIYKIKAISLFKFADGFLFLLITKRIIHLF